MYIRHIYSDSTLDTAAHRPYTPHPLSTHTKPLEIHKHRSIATLSTTFAFSFCSKTLELKIKLHVINMSLCSQSFFTIHTPSQAHTLITYIPSHTRRHSLTHPIELVVESAWVTDGVSIFRSPPKHSLHGAAIGTLVVHALQCGFL